MFERLILIGFLIALILAAIGGVFDIDK